MRASKPVFNICFVAAIFVCAASAASAQKSSIVLKKSVSPVHSQELTNKLRSITGWSSLEFDLEGALTFTESRVNGGSKFARELLLKAMSGRHLIVI